MTIKCQKLIDKVLDKVMEGGNITNIGKEEGMPRAQTWYNWLKTDEKLREDYAAATSLRAETYFNEIIEIADDFSVNESNENIQRARLRIDSRKWISARLAPTKYGEQTQRSGADEDTTVHQKTTEYANGG